MSPVMAKQKSYISNTLNDEVMDEDEALGKKLNENFLNTWSHLDKIENYFKPAQFYSLNKLAEIISIIDVELVEMNQKCYLYVLHKNDFDKAVATISKQPISRLSIF